jgi:hypothetical protein
LILRISYTYRTPQRSGEYDEGQSRC